MKRGYYYKKFFGIVLMFVGVTLILNSLSGITGFAIAEEIGTEFSSIFGFAILLLGMFLYVGVEPEKVEENLAQELLKKGKIPNRPLELKDIAQKMRYTVRDILDEYQVRDKYGELLVSIPNSPLNEKAARQILKTLVAGEFKPKKKHS